MSAVTALAPPASAAVPDPISAPTAVEAPMTAAPEPAPAPVIELAHPMPGFPEARAFALVPLDEDGVLCALRSLEDPALRFLVVPPAPFFPDYAPEVHEAALAELELGEPEDALVLLVVTAGASLRDTTANLLAPVVVNRHTLRAMQVVLDDPALAVRAPLVA